MSALAHVPAEPTLPPTGPAASTKSRAPALRELLSDESGATMVMGVFMAAMLVGMIYYVWGIGGMVIHRERLQDAADTAAFGAAVIHARGMNLVVVLNTLMLLMAIIGTAMQIVPYIVGAAAAAAGAECLELLDVCWFFCVCCPACESAVEHGIDLISAIDDASDWDDRTTRVLNGLNQAAHGVSRGAPAMAQMLAVTYGTSTYQPTTSMGGADIIPFATQLQLEDDDSGYVCGLVFEHFNFTSEHGALGMSTASLFTAGVTAATLVASMSATRADSWFWEGYAVGFVLGYLIEHDDYCDSYLRVPEDSWLGERQFQIHTAMYGRPGWTWTTQGVAVANWGRMGSETTSYVAGIDPAYANSVALAQAEYYWECDAGDVKEEWMFQPRWRARMRRFTTNSLAGGVLGSVPGVGSVLGAIDGLIIH